jgi:hypothetical protein
MHILHLIARNKQSARTNKVATAMEEPSHTSDECYFRV